MGIVGVARWKNGGQDDFQALLDNIMKGYMCKREGKWSMTLHSYRSGTFPSRSIYTVSTSAYTYALLEDVSIPPPSIQLPLPPTRQVPGTPRPTRTQFVTIPSPEALPTLLSQISGNWTSSRQNNAAHSGRGVVFGVGPQVLLEGHTYTIAGDWVVRVGSVTQGPGAPGGASGAARGIIIEVEYLPLSKQPAPQPETGNGPLITEFLMTIVPKASQHQILAVALSPQQWAEILKPGRDDDGGPVGKEEEQEADKQENEEGEELDDVLWTGDGEDEAAKDVHPTHERERRSAYLILRCLQGEGLL
ncbi:uncharacterized protein EI90DRAFT_3093526 [Cantharellus anzutake]|uniref:uncharacterized protein n=1 Tax=Cantharellus anzutake TaxID=1750568 RepID=UPI001905EF37|nr:uncharacterized protein EI90DRAFT_3093526 [Cantharellus anzutake]KAF8312557.1 hypothetical protein EI90DRAFT_3093526 [Cantharellus anzutake]